jgi:putative SOS response-associated peptidase YedK
MCGRYTLRRMDVIEIAMGLQAPPLFEEFSDHPHFNIAPSQSIPLVRINSSGQRVLNLARWGLIPSWAKELPKFQPINARAETVATSGMFRQALGRRRCLIPADGFYEWKKLDDAGKRKQPMYITRKDGGVFAFAGLWERWKPDEKSEPIDTCTIITTTPNSLMESIHDRMPVILDPSDYSRWLDRETGGADVEGLLKPCPPEGWQARPVSTRVNSPKNDDPECIAAVTQEHT